MHIKVMKPARVQANILSMLAVKFDTLPSKVFAGSSSNVG